jgi:hypothetical protein
MAIIKTAEGTVKPAVAANAPRSRHESSPVRKPPDYWQVLAESYKITISVLGKPLSPFDDFTFKIT